MELLSHLEGELQARDIAIAALKSEQLKRVLYGLHATTATTSSSSTAAIKPSSSSSQSTNAVPSTSDGSGAGNNDEGAVGNCATSGSKAAANQLLQCPLSALQRDKLHSGDANRVEESLQVCTSTTETEMAALHDIIEKQRFAAAKIADCLRQSETLRCEALKDLESEKQKHKLLPLSAVTAVAASSADGGSGSNTAGDQSREGLAGGGGPTVGGESAAVAAAVTYNYELE